MLRLEIAIARSQITVVAIAVALPAARLASKWSTRTATERESALYHSLTVALALHVVLFTKFIRWKGELGATARPPSSVAQLTCPKQDVRACALSP